MIMMMTVFSSMVLKLTLDPSQIRRRFQTFAQNVEKSVGTVRDLNPLCPRFGSGCESSICLITKHLQRPSITHLNARTCTKMHPVRLRFVSGNAF